MTNPFVYSRPVEPEQLIDRDLAANRLVELAEGGHATRLSAPRRYGKTSLLYRVKRDAERVDMACVYVDFSRAVSVADVANTIDHAYRRSLQGTVRRTAVAVLRSLDLRGRVTPGGIGVEVGRRGETDLARALGDLLDLPLSLHERTGRRTLVVFDEFQELLAAGDQLDGLFRSRIQHHGEAASYIYAGSRPSLLRELFAGRERPLYGQAQPMHLDPLSDPDLADYIGDRFERTGKDAGAALEPVLDVAKGHPQRAMMLAHHLWAATPRGEPAGAEAFLRAFEIVRAESGDAVEAAWSSFERSERAVLAALAGTDEPLLGHRTLESFNLAKSTAQEARDRLIAQGVLHEIGGDVRIVDPLLAEFAAHRTSSGDDKYAR